MLKERMKWIIAGIVVIVLILIIIGAREKGTMEAVSVDGKWEAYAMETTNEGETLWRGVVVYRGENPDDIEQVQTQSCVNGVKEDYVKRELKESGTLGVKKSAAGGAKKFYVFMSGKEQKPKSLSVKIRWKEKDQNEVEKLWLIDQ